jgi:hypothetical protein
VAGTIRPPGRDRIGLAEAEPAQQALLVLAHLRKGETSAELTTGFGRKLDGLAVRGRDCRATGRTIAEAAPGGCAAPERCTRMSFSTAPSSRSTGSPRTGPFSGNMRRPDLGVRGALSSSVHNRKATWI